MGKGRYTERGRQRAAEIEGILRENEHGMTSWQLAEALGFKSTKGGLDSTLASLQRHGVLVSEDELGRLWLFEERGLYSVPRDWEMR